MPRMRWPVERTEATEVADFVVGSLADSIPNAGGRTTAGGVECELDVVAFFEVIAAPITDRIEQTIATDIVEKSSATTTRVIQVIVWDVDRIVPSPRAQ